MNKQRLTRNSIILGKVGLYIYHSSCIQSSHKQSFIFTCFISHRLNGDEAKAKVWYELNNPTFIKRNRPGESKRSKRVRAERKTREEVKQRDEESRLARLATAATMKKSLPSSLSPPIRSYLLGKRNKKYVVIPPSLPSAISTISVDRVELSATICFFDYYLTIVERK